MRRSTSTSAWGMKCWEDLDIQNTPGNMPLSWRTGRRRSCAPWITANAEIELARITGYLHDIGNCVNRHDHAHSGAVMAFQILRGMKFQPEDIAIIVSAIGNHDEATGTAVTPVSAAVIIADKTDVRANRVRNTDIAFFDKHDRVNYAAIKTKLTTDAKKKVIHLNIKLDEQICSVLDYFEIFTDRMLMSRRAAEILGLKFKFTVNGNKVL